MGAIAVRRLRLRAPPGQSAATCQRAEDALRVGAAGEERLVVVRRLDLGRLPVAARAGLWSARVEALMAAARARAVHGAAPGAAGADAVWFHSAAEAQALLLRELAAGRTPIAWFWRLAVPDWDGGPLSPWLAAAIRRVEADPAAEIALAHALVGALEGGGDASILAALRTVPLPEPLPSPDPPPEVSTRQAGPVGSARVAAALRATRLLERHGSAIGRVLGELRPNHRPVEPAHLWILRLALVAAAPQLAGRRTQLFETMRALLGTPSTAPDAGGLPEVANAAPERPTKGAPDRIRPPEPPRSRPHMTQPPAAEPAPAPPAPVPEGSPPPRQMPPSLLPADPMGVVSSEERASAGAGLVLLIRPLGVMGIEAWLERRPELAADGFGRGLLRHIARRARVPAENPVLEALAGEERVDWTVPLTAWRVGLDRWLWRRARRRLAPIVRRRGWIIAQPEALIVRFPVEAADLALRRRALDLDPGWVPWLGLVLRYHYRDEPVG